MPLRGGGVAKYNMSLSCTSEPLEMPKRNKKQQISPGQTRDKILISTRNRERTVHNSYYLINVELHFKCEVEFDFKRQEKTRVASGCRRIKWPVNNTFVDRPM